MFYERSWIFLKNLYERSIHLNYFKKFIQFFIVNLIE